MCYAVTGTAQSCQENQKLKEHSKVVTDETNGVTTCTPIIESLLPDENPDSYEADQYYTGQTEKRGSLIPWSKLSINILKKPLYACYTPRSGGTVYTFGKILQANEPDSGYIIV
jgi:hypothetical protein